MSMNPVNELQLEQSVYTLFQAFLSGLFDGGTHAIGGNANVQFPMLYQTTTANGVTTVTLDNLRFGQSAVPQPLKGVALTMMFMQGTTKKYWDTVDGGTQYMAWTRARFLFWIRAELQSTSLGNAELQCRKVSDCLKAVLENPQASRPLTQNGVHRVRPGAPQPVSETLYKLVLLPVQAMLRYPVLVN